MIFSALAGSSLAEVGAVRAAQPDLVSVSVPCQATFAWWFTTGRSLGGICWWLALRAGSRFVCGFQSFLRPSVMVVPVRGSGRRVCVLAAGFRVHDPAASQASSTRASQNKGTGQIKRKIKREIKGHKQDQELKIKVKVKGCDEGPGLRRASATSGKLARFPRVAG
ncbi:hypothetical protein [Catenulispora pinisilvae]|uniref:hypothetical protein n=1 Tax=Catenulispora pinisilvae TaxID=2705253 RepID=UPI001892584D|nr:hypothetical protein [Catenulispora pinisilvae]